MIIKDKKTALRDTARVFRYTITFMVRKSDDDPFVSLEEWEPYIKCKADQRWNRTRVYYKSDIPTVEIIKEFIVHSRYDIDESMMVYQKIGNEIKKYEIDGILPLESDNLYNRVAVREIKGDI